MGDVEFEFFNFSEGCGGRGCICGVGFYDMIKVVMVFGG